MKPRSKKPMCRPPPCPPARACRRAASSPAHAWDFVDAPLAHQAFLGGQLKQEGLQARWVLPFERYVELGMELGNGNAFPGNERNRNGAGALLLSAHTGGDVVLSHSWRAGVSWMRTRADGREWESEAPKGGVAPLTNSFTGRSRIWAVDGVWKWATAQMR